ncbi:MAG: glycosyltransferase [Chloroflexota bacterium]
MRRILFCTDSLMAGGTEQQLVELLTHLDRRQFEPCVVCLYAGRAGRSVHFLSRLQALNIPVFVLDLSWRARGKMIGITQIIRLIWQLRPHIVQAVNYHSNLLLRLARPFLPFSLKLIGCVFVTYTPKQLRYERLSSFLCNAIACNSLHIKLHLPGHRRIVCIPNGVDTARFSAPPRLEDCDQEGAEAQFVLLMLGRIARQKAPHLIVEALGRLKTLSELPSHVRLWIVGEREDQQAQSAVQNAVEQYGLQSVVFQFPATNAPECFYHAADVTVLTSVFEGLPGVVLESLAAGCPMILSDAANCANGVEHGVTGWVFRTGNVDDLKELLRTVLALPSCDLALMRSACQLRAAAFPVTQMVERYQNLYENLLSRS